MGRGQQKWRENYEVRPTLDLPATRGWDPLGEVRRSRRRKWLRSGGLGVWGLRFRHSSGRWKSLLLPPGQAGCDQQPFGRLRGSGMQPPTNVVSGPLGWGRGGAGRAAQGPGARLSPTLSPADHPRCGPACAHLPRSAPPTASAVRSRAPPQLRPESWLVTQQRRAAFRPAAICAASGVRPRTATKKRKTVPVCASCTGQGFMERCPSRAAVPITRAAPHCREVRGFSFLPAHTGRPSPTPPTPPPLPNLSPARSPPPACRASAPGGARVCRQG